MRLAAQVASVERARQAVAAFTAGHGFTDAAVHRIELVLEELLMNIARHAYPQGGEHSLQLRGWLEPDALTLQIEDDGVPFDPTRAAPARRPADAEPGGWGLPLVRRSVLGWQYQRADGRNRLTARLGRR